MLATKLSLTSKEIVRTDLPVKSRQNRQFVAEMFLLFSEFVG